MEILNEVYGFVMPLVGTGIFAFLVKIVGGVGDILIKYGEQKIDQSSITKEIATHEKEITFAKEVWNIVEEKFRVTENVEEFISSKADYFDNLLLKKLPYLTKDELVSLRQAIAGEFNKGKQAVLSDQSLKEVISKLQNENSTITNENLELKNKNDILAKENEQLKAKISQITSTVVGQ